MTVFRLKNFTKLLCALMFMMVGLQSCQSTYDKTVKNEMAHGERYDILKFDLSFGDTKKEFFAKCWELNKKGLITQGPKNQYVAYALKNDSTQNITHLFYGIFDDNQKMVGLDMEFAYDGWSPWTPELQSDQLMFVAMDTLKSWYPGNDFFKVTNKKLNKDTYVKIDGNRQIIVQTATDKDVKVTLEDLRHKFPKLK
ncbi:MAG: hypothetical protein MRY51_03775 [Flavobacteriaceae bacterium]|nr:hypothetical protein [Flavobacteriaceae bacterium]MCI5088090.1 hypothetical protein [Flavobacteriaceae bacterium]